MDNLLRILLQHYLGWGKSPEDVAYVEDYLKVHGLHPDHPPAEPALAVEEPASPEEGEEKSDASIT